MKKSRRLLLLLVVSLLLLAIPITALANKQVWKARLTTGAELHQVVGSQASGAAVFATNPDGSLHFMLQVRGLSGPVVGAHIHGPATEAQNAPVAVTLCGNPAPAAVADCSYADGVLSIEGDITSGLLAQWGLPGRTLFEWLNTGMAYVNVHTSLNPAGETRGQIYPR